ncbi:hypothetical protein [uncultured Thiodictyon sp.]|jgi:hypothetical protein|uniref:hypothetical protein n=1 Tax=uncultured Thiodictyon sp. TaxID=1846217 RepID=UPI0025E391B5|nr:hypothetical protein [uncultured Thiodictyon sp.]
MSAADQLIQDITREIAALPKGRYGEVILADDRFADLPAPEDFLFPEPDVRDGPSEGAPFGNVAANPCLLGCYWPMHNSPGQIDLFEGNLRRFYWSLVGALRHDFPSLFTRDLEGALHLVVKKTDYHERFHFHSDVLRQLSGSPFDPLHEEALAVAWSRMTLLGEHGNSKIWQVNRVFHDRLLGAAFAFRSPGYRDWPNYADEPRFKLAWLNYLSPRSSRRLEANGVGNLQDLMFGLLGQVAGGCVDHLV